MASGNVSWRSWFPPLTKASLFQHYAPLCGAAGHAAFAVHILNPALLGRSLCRFDLAVSNALFFNSHIGSGLYLYSRHHMRKVSPRTRVMYSVYVAVLMNFGSVLFWAATKAILPENQWVRALFGVLTSFSIVSLGKEYLGYIDSLVSDDVD